MKIRFVIRAVLKNYKDRGDIYPVVSSSDNHHYEIWPAITLVNSENLKMHKRKAFTGWELFRQKKL